MAYQIRLKLELQDEDEAIALRELLNKYCVSVSHVIHSNPISQKEQRLSCIMTNVVPKTEYNMGGLYKKVRIKGYAMRYKTFQRDIMYLILEKRLEGITRLNGNLGKTTILRRI